jgi:hypothetical protein
LRFEVLTVVNVYILSDYNVTLCSVVCDHVISEELGISVFRVKLEPAGTFLQNVSNHISDYIVSQSGSPKFEIFLMGAVKIFIFWDVVPWSLVECYQHCRFL